MSGMNEKEFCRYQNWCLMDLMIRIDGEKQDVILRQLQLGMEV